MRKAFPTVLAFFALLAAAAAEGNGPVWAQIAQLYSSDTDSQDSFGETVAIDGDTLVVAAYRKDGETGAVYVFERSQGAPTEWLETKKLTPQPGDTFFGLVLAISGDTLALMAEAIDGEALYLFERDLGGEGAWGQVGRFATDEVSSLGRAGDMLGVGDRDFDLGGQLNVGAVHLLERGPDGPTDWSYLTTLTASDADPQDRFGDAQALSGDHLLIGAPDAADLGIDSGAAYVFERDEAGEWVEVVKLLRPDGDASDHFGFALDLDVDTALVAGDADGGDEAAFVYERDDLSGEWVFTKELRPSDTDGSDAFGDSAAISGDVAVVGAWGFSLPDLFTSGAAFVFERHQDGAESWGEVAKIMASDPQELDQFGEHLALDGNTLVVGVDEDDDRGFDAGTAYLFSRTAPLLSVTGSCPGRLAVLVIGTTPSGEVVLVGAESEGVTPIPSGPCAGTEVGLAAPRVLFTGAATSAGDLELAPEVGPGVCGAFVQAVDVATCATSAVVRAP